METSYLVNQITVNQITGFHMKCNTELKYVKQKNRPDKLQMQYRILDVINW